MRKVAILAIPTLLCILILASAINKQPSDPVTSVAVPQVEETKIVDRLNARNAQITSIYCSDVSVRLSGHFATLKGWMLYQKPKDFRMLIYSPISKEFDLGSNKNVFWFWSHRSKPETVFYAAHDDLFKTRLKAPLNPIWIMRSIGIDSIAKDGYISQNDRFWYIYLPDLDTTGAGVIRVLVIDKAKECQVAQYVFKNSKLLCATIVEELVLVDGFYLPQKMRSEWFEEKITVFWMLRNAKINKTYGQQTFTLPDTKSKVDMTKD
jgi:hypothetical protein